MRLFQTAVNRLGGHGGQCLAQPAVGLGAHPPGNAPHTGQVQLVDAPLGGDVTGKAPQRPVVVRNEKGVAEDAVEQLVKVFAVEQHRIFGEHPNQPLRLGQKAQAVGAHSPHLGAGGGGQPTDGQAKKAQVQIQLAAGHLQHFQGHPVLPLGLGFGFGHCGPPFRRRMDGAASGWVQSNE